MEHKLLGSLLQVSRLLGIAPFIRGPDYRVSRVIDICGKIALTCINIIAAGGIIYKIIYDTEAILITIDIIDIISRLWVTVVVPIATFTAAGRMTRISEILKQLDQIDQNISRRRNPSGNRKIVFVLTCLYITSSLLLRVKHFVRIILVADEYFIFPLILVIGYPITILLEAQIITLAGRVLVTLVTINDELEDLIPGKYPTSISDTKPTVPRAAWENIKTNTVRLNRYPNICPRDVQDKYNVDSPESDIPLTLRRLALHYFEICEIVRTITKFEGFLMILLILHHMLQLEFSWFQIILGLTNFKSYEIVLPMLVRSIIHVAALILCTETFHQTHVQMDRTHLAVNFLKCQRRDNEEVSNELETFLRLLLLNKTTYSPLSVCTLSRSLIVKIFGCLVTYLVIIMTYGVEVNDPTLVLADRRALI